MNSARQRWSDVAVYMVLVTFTAMEVSVVRLDLDRALRIVALVGLATAKGAALLLFFMRLRSESRTLKVLVSLPLFLAPAFAVVLMLDAVYRLAGAP